MLLVLINLPVNIALGGGGIALMAGISRNFATRWFVVCVAVAVVPVPLSLVRFGDYPGSWSL